MSFPITNAADAFYGPVRHPGAWDDLGALAAKLTLSRSNGHQVAADPDGADRDVELWAPEVRDNGHCYVILNVGGANALAVKPLDHAGVAGAALATLAAGEAGVFYVKDAAWVLHIIHTGLRR